MKLVFADSLATVDADQWNALAGTQDDSGNPFIQYEFLRALEQHDCLEPWGWQPQHCLLYDNGELVGACPAYLKTNSYGEFVFDWAWADAYEKHGLSWYPKLVCAIPFTPARGPRLLAKTGHCRPDGTAVSAETIKQALIDALLAFAEKNSLSSAHFLFAQDQDQQRLENAGLLPRIDYQFHWQNHDYAGFDDFLAGLSSKRRKNIRRERRTVSTGNIRTRIIPGAELSEEQWQQLYAYYQVTFLRKSGAATLTLDFFRAVAASLVAFFAYDGDRPVAAAVCFRGQQTLYGRHWGCSEHHDSLHFELCYYTGIEYCIENRLQYFEPGAQGEHKIWRGFEPVKTRSAHWIADPGFRCAIADFLRREQAAMLHHGELLAASSAYRQTVNRCE